MKNNIRKNVYEEITNRLIESLDKGVIPWRKTWKGGADGAPRSMNTNKFYRGINVPLLSMSQLAGGYTSNYWLTFKQAKALGGSVMKGEKGTGIVYWAPYQKKDAAGNPAVEKNGKPSMNFMLRRYTVFNLEQTECVEVPADREVAAPGEPSEAVDAEACALADLVFDEYTKREGIVVVRSGDAAYFAQQLDAIKLPAPDSYDVVEDAASTAFHEAVHSTGTKGRLNRPGIADIDYAGSHRYADEELVAEFGATFLCSMVGIERDENIENSAAYIANWKTKCLEDPKLLVYAAQRAQKAADYILGSSVEEDQ